MARRNIAAKTLGLIVTLPVTLLVVLFAVSNRHAVDMTLWPLPSSVTAPLFLVALIAMLFGFLLGGFVVWNSGRIWRKRARTAEKHSKTLSDDLQRTETALEKSRLALPGAAEKA